MNRSIVVVLLAAFALGGCSTAALELLKAERPDRIQLKTLPGHPPAVVSKQEGYWI